jgi:hypothetical protein
MLAISPADRFQTAAEVRAALDQVRLAPDPDSPISTSGATLIPPRDSLDPSTAPTLELPPPSLPSWAPAWMRRPTVRSAARKALTVASIALVGGAAVGAAIAAAISRDDETPPPTAGTRGDSVALSGARPATGATTGVSAIATKTPPETTAAGVGATGRTTTSRSATPTTPRGSVTGANRARPDSAVVPRPPDRRPMGASSTVPPSVLAPIRRFAQAVLSGKVEEIQKAYPRMTENQRKNWENLFRGAKPEETQLREVTGVSGPGPGPTKPTVVDFVMAVRFSDRQTGSPIHVPASRYRATLRIEGANLVLYSLTERPR